MPTVHYYGKLNKFVGKTLFEILANLRNFGINRMIIKQEELLRNPGTKCYYIVKKVEPVMDPELKEGAIYAEQVFCNAKVPGLVYVEEPSWHNDWQLVPKNEEDKHRITADELIEHGHPDTYRVLPRWMEVPPVMDIYLRRHYKARSGVQLTPVKMTDPMQIMMHYNFESINKPYKLHRIAEEGEESPCLYNKPLKTLIGPNFRPGVTKRVEAAQAKQ